MDCWDTPLVRLPDGGVLRQYLVVDYWDRELAGLLVGGLLGHTTGQTSRWWGTETVLGGGLLGQSTSWTTGWWTTGTHYWSRLPDGGVLRQYWMVDYWDRVLAGLLAGGLLGHTTGWTAR